MFLALTDVSGCVWLLAELPGGFPRKILIPWEEKTGV